MAATTQKKIFQEKSMNLSVVSPEQNISDKKIMKKTIPRNQFMYKIIKTLVFTLIYGLHLFCRFLMSTPLILAMKT